MAQKKFNSVEGFSVGIPGNVIDVVDSVANVYANRIFVQQYANLGDIGNIYIGGGLNNQVLKTNGSGNLYWSIDSAPAGGNTTEVQFNTGGSLDGSAGLTFSKISNALTITGNITSGNAILGNLATANYFNGNGSLLTSITASNVIGQVANALVAGTVYSNAQPNITSVGTLTSLSISTIGSISGANSISANFVTGTLTTQAQPNITSVGTLTTVNVAGNVTSGNASLGNLVTANYFSGNASLLTGVISNANYAAYAGNVVSASQPNITSVGILSSLTVSGLITATTTGIRVSNIQDSTGTTTIQTRYNTNPGDVGITSNLTVGAGGTGNLTVNGVSDLGPVGNVKISGGTANFVLQTNGSGGLSWVSPSSVGIAGANTQVQFNDNGAFGASGNFFFNKASNTLTVDNFRSVSGNILGANLVSANFFTGTLTTALQPNITSVGSLTSLNVIGNITSGNAILGNLVTANYFSGNGSLLTSLTGGSVTGQVANALVAGTVYGNAQPNITSIGTLVSANISGNVSSGGNIIGNGQYLSSLNGSNVTGQVANALVAGTVYGNAQPNITSIGTLVSANISGNVSSGGNIIGNGQYLTSINGSNVTGQVANALVAGTVYTGAQPNITSVGTLVDANISGNLLIAGNLIVSGTTEYTNVNNLYIKDPIIEMGGGANNTPLTTNDGKDRGSLLHYYTTQPVDAFIGWDNSNGEFALGSNVSISSEVVTFNSFGNLRLGNIFGSGLQLIGNITSGNAILGNLVTANYFSGNGSLLTSLTGGNVTGQVANALVSGTVYGNVQSNITTVGTLSSLSVTGLTTATGGVKVGNIQDTAGTNTISVASSTVGIIGNLTVGTGGAGNVTATYFIGNGATLTNITGGNVTGQVANALVAGTVYGNAQPNITSIGTLISANISGNVSSGGNIIGNGQYLSAITGSNVTGQVANALVAGTVYSNAQPNITSVGSLTSLNVIGNITSGNASLGNLVTANFFSGDGSLLTNLTAGSRITNGTSNVTIASANSNITFGVNGTSNVIVVGSSQVSVLGNFSVTGNILRDNKNIPTYTSSTTAPTNPRAGDQWYDQDNDVTYQYIFDGATSLWVDISSGYVGANIQAIGNTLVQRDANANIYANYFVGNGLISSGVSNLGPVGNVIITGGTANFVLQTNGSGNLSWVSPGSFSTSAAGSNTQVQFNDGGTFGADANFTYNKVTDTLGVRFVAVEPTGNIIGGNLVSANFITGTLTTAAQPNITSVGTLINANINGNLLIGGNLTVNGALEYTNVTNLYIQDPIIEMGGNANAGALTFNDGKDRGTLLHYYTTRAVDAFMGWDNSNGEFAFGSNVSVTNEIVTFNNFGNVRAGNVIGTHYGNGYNLSGLFGSNVIGQVANALVAGTVYTAAQPSITSVGTLTSLNVTGNISTAGSVIGTHFGNGYNLSGLFGSNVLGQVGNALVAGTVYVAAQPSITSLGTLTSLNVTGNISTAGSVIGTHFGNGYNLSGLFGSNVIGQVANALVASTVYSNAQPNITSLGTLTSLSVTGNISANYFIGNGSLLTGLPASYSNANVALYLPTYTGNISANYFIGNGATLTNITGANVVGQVGNALVAGTVYSNVQPNITSVGTLTSLVVSGNANIGGTLFANAIVGPSTPNVTITANTFVSRFDEFGNITLSNNVSVVGNLTVNQNVNFTNTSNVALGAVGNVKITGGSSGFVLKTDGTGNLSWGADSTNPAGSNTQVQFNDGGTSLGASAAFTFNKGTNALSITGNISAGNINGGNTVVANYFVGDGSLLTGLPSAYSNANVAAYLPTYTGNISAAYFIGNGFALSSITGSNVTGQVANALVAGTVYSNAQPNITSVGTLSSLSVIGNVSAGNINGGNAIVANYFVGNGSLLTGLPASYSNANVALYLPTYTGNASANYFIGNGSALTNITGGNVTGQVGNALVAGTVYSNAQPNITSVGTLTDLTVNGLTNLGSVANITITGGTSGYVLTTDGSGGLTWGAAGSGAAGLVSISKDRFLTTGSANTFSLSTTPASKNLIEVVIDGLQQISNTYSLTGTVLSFPTNPASGQVIEVTTFGAVDLTGNVGEVQFNAGGSFGASNTFTFNTGTNTLSVTNLTATGNLTSQGGYVYIDNALIAVSSGNAGIFNTSVSNINIGLVANVTMGSTSGNVTARGTFNATNANVSGNLNVTGNTIVTNLSANDFISNRSAVTVTTNTIIDQFSVNTYRSAKYTMRVNSDDGYQAVEVLLVHNGSSSFVTIYGSISSSGSDIVSLSSNIGSGNVRLFASTASTNTNVKILGTYVPD